MTETISFTIDGQYKSRRGVVVKVISMFPEHPGFPIIVEEQIEDGRIYSITKKGSFISDNNPDKYDVIEAI